MGFRITTNMVLNSYRYNLQNSTKKLTDARDMVLTGRAFSNYADDPASATLAFRLRRSWYQTNNYLANTQDVYSKYDTAWQNLAGVVEELSDRTARVASIRGNNGATGEARSALAIDLRETAESVVQALNQKLGDHFIFAGNDALNAPFSWNGDGTILYYRGVNINAGGVERPEGAPPAWAAALENWTEESGQGKYILDSFGTPDADAILGDYGDPLSEADAQWLAYYQDRADLRKLEKMSGEEMYIDLGMGAAEKAANMPVKGTYFNSALCGIDFLGFGVDEDGDPKNLALIMKELADVFDCWDEDTDPQGYNADLAKDSAAGLSRDELEAKAFRLMDKLKAAQEHTTEMWVELDAKAVYLQESESRLAIQATELNIRFVDLEEVDEAEAISIFAYQSYCYNAALKIGNQLLSQSLIDYMT